MSQLIKTDSMGMAGIVATLVGTLFAVFLMPPDPAAKGALVSSAIVLAAGILFVPAIRVLNGTATMLNAENFVAIGFVYWILLDSIQGAYDLSGTTNEAIMYAMVAIGVSAAAMWSGTLTRPWQVPASLIILASRPLDASALFKIAFVCFLLGMSKYVYGVDFDLWAMFSYLGEDRWAAPWGRGQLGGWDAFLDHAQYFGYVLPSIAVFLGVRRGWARPESVLTLAFAVIMVAFLAQGGGRRIIGVTVGAAIIVWILARPELKLSKLIGVGLGVTGLLLGMQFILEIRSQGFAEFLDHGGQYSYLHVDDNFLRMAQLIELIPSQHPFVYFKQILFVMVRPIPRVFWEGKPIDPGFDLPTALGMEGVSLSSSILGEWYLSFGWAGLIVGGWLHGRLATAVNTLRQAQIVTANPMAYALSVMVLFSGIRSMQDLVIMSYAVLAWFAVTSLLSRGRRLASRS